ncbi:hypothetical protein FGU71_09855 [Erythrobacter insulae]|uniref:Type IV secretion system protein VirB9 n=1 Tax=Erythrobacter insulae TaxID=2584124 RepID=A0A547PDB1_9SPHN|nr:TrbG/VirB9 family P-type conjugative transfer protein [Erythrobacter insulae]TRD12133.1 hypothetical protein FGU71_09855 [Erythrobacter insulae]
MITRFALIICAACALGPSLAAQTYPMPGAETPRIQSVEWNNGDVIVLTALPDTFLTVMLEPGETIRQATISGDTSWTVSVSAEADSFQIKGASDAVATQLKIETDMRSYDFKLETDYGLQSAYLVRLAYGPQDRPAAVAEANSTTIDNLVWSYRIRGDKSVRPASIRDNGEKTVIEYLPDQPLPAVFAIGATGDEEVVDGYMRGDRFVIDRVHQRLVFRIDKEKATARRNVTREDS